MNYRNESIQTTLNICIIHDNGKIVINMESLEIIDLIARTMENKELDVFFMKYVEEKNTNLIELKEDIELIGEKIEECNTSVDSRFIPLVLEKLKYLRKTIDKVNLIESRQTKDKKSKQKNSR